MIRRTCCDHMLHWVVSSGMTVETFCLAFYMFEKYLSIRTVNSDQFLLIIVTCLFSASKFEEIYFYPPKLFVDNAKNRNITSKSILSTEAKILNVLNYRLIHVCPIDILRRIVFILEANSKIGIFNICVTQIILNSRFSKYAFSK